MTGFSQSRAGRPETIRRATARRSWQRWAGVRQIVVLNDRLWRATMLKNGPRAVYARLAAHCPERCLAADSAGWLACSPSAGYGMGSRLLEISLCR